MSREWTQRAERGTVFTLHLIRWIALHLGRPAARFVLYPIALYFFMFAPAARRASSSYLRRLRGRPAPWWQTAKHIHHFSATVLDRVFLLTGRQEELDIAVYGAESVFELAESGAGCILLGAHLGSFEVLRALGVSRHHLRLKVLMQEAHNETITRVLHTLNPEIADTVIPLGKPDSLLKAHEFLQQGYFIGILGDRVVDADKTVSCRFLDGEAEFPSGPLLAAAALKVPVILFVGLYEGGRRYEIHFERLADRVDIDRNRRAEDLQHWTQRYADRLAYYTRKSPYNWFNFYEFWKKAA